MWLHNQQIVGLIISPQLKLQTVLGLLCQSKKIKAFRMVILYSHTGISDPVQSSICYLLLITRIVSSRNFNHILYVCG
jgi:hypothetical protein